MYTALQSFTIIGLLFSWIAYAGRIPHIGVIAKSLYQSMLPLFEVGITSFVLLLLLGMLIHLQAGNRTEGYSTATSSLQLIWYHFIIGAVPLDIRAYAQCN